jgi:hypothetical protein
MTLIEYVRSVLLSSDLLYAADSVNIAFIGASGTQYSLEPNHGISVVKRYLGGAERRRFTCNLVSLQPFISEEDRIQATQDYEHLSRWLRQQTYKRLLPPLSELETVHSLATTGLPYIITRQNNGNYALFAVALEMQYTSEME